MSIHIQTIPIPFGMDPTTYFMSIAGPGAKAVKATTTVTDYDLMQDILANSTIGFKSKRDLMDFQNRCSMFFEDNGRTIDITFIGHFTNQEVNKFISGLNREFNQSMGYSTNNLNQYNNTGDELRKEKQRKEKERKKREKQNKINSQKRKQKIEPIKIEKDKYETPEVIEDKTEDIIIEETVIPENQFIISSNLKEKSIINQVLNESYVGYNSKEELEKFRNIGKISFNKTINGTYDFVFTGDYDEEEAKKYVKNISDEYALKVQEQTYLKLIEKIKKEKLNLESEIVDSEDSIILTLNI